MNRFIGQMVHGRDLYSFILFGKQYLWSYLKDAAFVDMQIILVPLHMDTYDTRAYRTRPCDS